MKKLLAASLFIILAALAASAIVPSESVVNPLTQTLYTVNNSASPAQVNVYTRNANDPQGWVQNAAKTITLPSPTAKCYGLAVSKDGKSLFVSINNTDLSKLRIYTLDSAGLPTGSTDAVWPLDADSSYSPAGIAIANDGRVYVANALAGKVFVFTYANNAWSKTDEISDQLTGMDNIFDAAVSSPFADGTYLLFACRKVDQAANKEIFVYRINANKSVTYLASFDAQTPSQLKVVGNKLYIATNGANGDIQVYTISQAAPYLTSLKTVSSVAGPFGMTAFDVNPRNTALYFTQGTDIIETTTEVYRVALPVNADAVATRVGAVTRSSDGVSFSSDGGAIAVAYSADGTIDQNIKATIAGNPAISGDLQVVSPVISAITPNSITHGTPANITISGSNFLASPQVQIQVNGQWLSLDSITVVSQNEIRATVGASIFATAPNATQTYTVKVTNSTTPANSGTSTLTITEKDTTPPALVTGFTASDNDPDKVTLNWTNPADSDLAGTILYRKTGSYPTLADQGNAIGIASKDTSTFVDTTATTGETYYYAAICIDTSGNYQFVSTPGSNADTGIRPQAEVTNPTITLVYPNRAPTDTIQTIEVEGTNFKDGVGFSIQLVDPSGVKPTINAGRIVFPPADPFGKQVHSPVTCTVNLNGAAVGDRNVVVTNPDGTSSTGVTLFHIIAKGSDSTDPDIVRDFKASLDKVEKIDLSWTNPAGDDLKKIIILRRSDTYPLQHDDVKADVVYEAFAPKPGDAETFTDSNVPELKYYYTIFTIDTSDNCKEAAKVGENAAIGKAVKAEINVLSISTIYPSKAPTGALINVVVEGELFNAGSTVKLSKDGTDINATNTTFNSSSSLACAFDLTGAAIGTYDLIVTNPGGFTASAKFVVIKAGSDITEAAQVTNFTASDNVADRINLAWTNPAGDDLKQIIVLRKNNTLICPKNHLDTKNATLVYQSNPPKPGETINYSDLDVTQNVNYAYAVFSVDTSDNWNDISTLGKNADTGKATTEGQQQGGAGTPISLVYDPQRTNVFWVSVPYNNNYHTASDIIRDINTQLGKAPDAGDTVTSIGRWMGSAITQQQESYDSMGELGWGGTDFAVNKGEAVYVYIAANTTFTLNGLNDPNFVFNSASLPYNANRTNIFWISLPYNGNFTNAASIIENINASLNLPVDSGAAVRSIGRWVGNINPQQQQSYDYMEGLGWGGDNFNFTPGEGYYISLYSPINGNWKPVVR